MTAWLVVRFSTVPKVSILFSPIAFAPQFRLIRLLTRTSVLLFGLGASLCATTIQTPSGLTVTVTAAGQFSVTRGSHNWTVVGDLSANASSLATGSGTDSIGSYKEITFDYVQGGLRHAGVRAYLLRQVVLFTLTYADAAQNGHGFPSFTSLPDNLMHMSYWNQFAHHDFGPMSEEGPRLYFDANGEAMILSPAQNFMVARTVTTSTGVESGISRDIPSIPAGFTHQSLLVLGTGINNTFEKWGSALTTLQGKKLPRNDADVTLRSLGYWTDAGASYYYNSEASFGGYEGTLSEIKSELRDKGIPLGYLQLDSWLYPKGATADWRDRSGGTFTYTAHPDNFPNGLKAFQHKVGVPLVTHNRWIDINSPYRQQYRFSGGVSTDPAFWQMLAESIKASGVSTYEQDWLGDKAHADFNLTDPEAFLSNMASAMAAQGVTMQYCMATPSHFMQGSKYSNLTTIRTSTDHFDRTRWQEFLYSSRFASALGIYPWADVFMSSEPDNILLATLSAGPVGVGDKIAELNRDNLLKAVRQDGIIVKPDVPMAPLDSAFLADAVDATGPLVSATYTEFNGTRASYVFSFARSSNTLTQFRPAELGHHGRVYIYNYFTGQGALADAADVYAEPMPGDRAYYIVVPVNDAGIALVGDTDNFVSLGKRRVNSVVPGETVSANVLFAAHENTRTLRGYSAAEPKFLVTTGTLLAHTYDAGTGQFTVTLAPWKSEANVTIAAAAEACTSNRFARGCSLATPVKAGTTEPRESLQSER